MKRFLIYPLIIYIFIVLLIPREKIYYLIEEQIAKKDLVLVENSISDFINLRIRDSILYYEEDVRLATIDQITFNTFLFYDSISLKGIKTLSIFSDLFGFDVFSVDIKYTSFNIFNLSINIMTNIGKVNGTFNIKTKYLKLELFPKQGYKVEGKISKIFKENDGGYIYEMDI